MGRRSLEKLKELYHTGKRDRKRKFGTEQAHQILFDAVISCNWQQKLIFTVPKIKAFFLLSPAKMEAALTNCDLELEDLI